MLSIVFDGIVAMLCCIGLVSLLCAFRLPRRKQDVFTAGLIVGNDAVRVQAWIHPMQQVAEDVIIVGTIGDAAREIELSHHRVTVLTPEQVTAYLKSKLPSGEDYGQGADQN